MTDPKPCDCNPEMQGMIKDMHLAVCGNETLGVSGLVRDMREIKAWRRGIDIRVASISGAITGFVLLVKALFTFNK